MSEDGIKTNGFNKTKVAGFVKSWTAAEERCAETIAKAMAKCKGEKDDILAAADQIGIKGKVFKNVIAEIKLRAKADAKRDELAESLGEREDAGDVLDQRDAVAMAAGLPLFDAAEEDKA